MRSLSVVTILFIILLTLIFINSSFIIQSSDKLISAAQAIPSTESENCKERLDIFEREWNKFKKAASFSVSYTELNKISCLIEELHVHVSNKNKVDFDHGLAIMINSLREIPRFEYFSADTIF